MSALSKVEALTPKTHTHSLIFTHKLLRQDPAFPQFPPLRVLGWIMQGLYPALKHEWIIWPQGQAVSTFPFTSLFIYLPTRRRTWRGQGRIWAWLTTCWPSTWPAFRRFTFSLFLGRAELSIRQGKEEPPPPPTINRVYHQLIQRLCRLLTD